MRNILINQMVLKKVDKLVKIYMAESFNKVGTGNYFLEDLSFVLD